MSTNNFMKHYKFIKILNNFFSDYQAIKSPICEFY